MTIEYRLQRVTDDIIDYLLTLVNGWEKYMVNMFTNYERELLNRLIDIEKEDENICNGCGGEDCICCEIYHDRQKWLSPDELFSDDEF